MTNSFLSVARDLALQAGRRIMELQKSPLVRERKPDYSLVTNADREADRIILDGLRKAFPDHAVLTEESGMNGPTKSNYVWMVDPLDGTRAYAKGVAGYSVMIGLVEAGVPYAGVVYDPFEDYLYEAVRGEGAFSVFQGVRNRLQVSLRSTLSEMPVITSTGFPETLDRPMRKELQGPWLKPVNSVGVKVGFLARKMVDVYINHHTVHFWDTCAPLVILQESGGTMTLWNGKSLDYSLSLGTTRHDGPTLATNSTRHQDLLHMVQGIRPLLS